MSNRRTRQQKIDAEKRNEVNKRKLLELQDEKIRLEQKFNEKKKEKNRQFNVRNLRVFKSTCRLLAPFVLVAGVTTGIFKFLEAGYPFIVDDVTAYKEYDLQYDDESVAVHDYYRKMGFMDSLEANSLVVYSPWEKKNDQYVRFKREYDVDPVTSLDLYDAVLNSDYESINNILTDYKEEIQSTSVMYEESKDYIIEANLHKLDKTDTLVYSETELENGLATLSWIIVNVGAGLVILYLREYDYTHDIWQINEEYHRAVDSFDLAKERLEAVDQKILSLSKRVGGAMR